MSRMKNVVVDFPILPIQNEQKGQNGKFEKYIFHSAHSASLLTLPFHSASRMDRNGKSKNTFFILVILPVCLLYHFILQAERAEWENRQRHFSFCSFCQFASFTISFCQQNEQNGPNGTFEKYIFHSAHSASLLTLPSPFHSASRMCRMRRMEKSIKTFFFHSASLLPLPFHFASLQPLPRQENEQVENLSRQLYTIRQPFE